MNDTVKISCVIDTTDPSCTLGIEIWLDNQIVFDCAHVKEPINFSHELLDSDARHQLKFCLKGKLPEHTQIDTHGNIVKDARISIRDLSFDEILLGNALTKLAVYTHNFNGTGTTVQDEFYEEIGCNGTVALEFSTPIYLWILENM